MKINSLRWNRIRYTLIAPIYDRVVGFGRQRRRSLELLELRPGERVLLVGAGTGLDLPHLPDGVEVVACDLTPAMLARLEARARALRRPVDAQVMDAQALALPDDHFDAVILHLVVAVVPDPVACLREAARVLRPGGRVGVLDKFAPEGRRPSLVRRVANLVTNVVATDITRRLEPLAREAGLRVVHREPVFPLAFFEVARLE